MLHLAVVTGDAACAPDRASGHPAAMDDATPMADHATPMAGHVMTTADAATAPVVSAVSATATDAPPCEAPVQRHCCEAIAGCGLASAVTGAEQALAPADLGAARIRETLHDAPASFAPAPEPPPPKA